MTLTQDTLVAPIQRYEGTLKRAADSISILNIYFTCCSQCLQGPSRPRGAGGTDREEDGQGPDK